MKKNHRPKTNGALRKIVVKVKVPFQICIVNYGQLNNTFTLFGDQRLQRWLASRGKIEFMMSREEIMFRLCDLAQILDQDVFRHNGISEDDCYEMISSIKGAQDYGKKAKEQEKCWQLIREKTWEVTKYLVVLVVLWYVLSFVYNNKKNA
jgi:hypothetical protein